jgi:hypothetical protein
MKREDGSQRHFGPCDIIMDTPPTAVKAATRK